MRSGRSFAGRTVPVLICLLAWGGQSTIARALKAIQDQYKDTPRWTTIYQKVSRKAIFSTSGDQDDTGKSYIKPNWPDIKTLPIGGDGVNSRTSAHWMWKEVDTYPGQVTFSNANALAMTMQAPADATAGQTIHLVLEATDNGTPALMRYQRVVVSVTR